MVNSVYELPSDYVMYDYVCSGTTTGLSLKIPRLGKLLLYNVELGC